MPADSDFVDTEHARHLLTRVITHNEANTNRPCSVRALAPARWHLLCLCFHSDEKCKQHCHFSTFAVPEPHTTTPTRVVVFLLFLVAHDPEQRDVGCVEARGSKVHHHRDRNEDSGCGGGKDCELPKQQCGSAQSCAATTAPLPSHMYA